MVDWFDHLRSPEGDVTLHCLTFVPNLQPVAIRPEPRRLIRWTMLFDDTLVSVGGKNVRSSTPLSMMLTPAADRLHFKAHSNGLGSVEPARHCG
jgi:hypothetical protein